MSDFVALVRDHTVLEERRGVLGRRRGRYIGDCPVCGEHALTINAEARLFYCFGCQTCGDEPAFRSLVEAWR